MAFDSTRTYDEHVAYYRAQFDALVASAPNTDPRRHEATVSQQAHADFNNTQPELMKRVINKISTFVS